MEFLAGVHPIDRPFDGRTKTLVRYGFHDRLPASVLGRTRGTTADEYLATSLLAQAPAFTDAFPSVPEGLSTMVDHSVYADLLDRVTEDRFTHADGWSLWSAWSLMLWDAQGRR